MCERAARIHLTDSPASEASVRERHVPGVSSRSLRRPCHDPLYPTPEPLFQLGNLRVEKTTTTTTGAVGAGGGGGGGGGKGGGEDVMRQQPYILRI